MSKSLSLLMSWKPLLAFYILGALLASPVAAVPVNVTAGKAVTSTGAIGVISAAGLLAGWGDSKRPGHAWPLDSLSHSR